jgi:hypothetical protein
MPIPVKLHTCQVCGAAVGAIQAHGKWVPEQHWPSVTYPARTTVSARYVRTASAREVEVSSASR